MIKIPTVFYVILLTLVSNFIANFGYAACVPHQPQVNGCSTYDIEAYIGVVVDPIAGAQIADSARIFNSQCDTHDRCYGKVGDAKDKCDSNFIKEIRTQCRKSYPGSWEVYKEFFETVQQTVTDAIKCGTKYVPKVCVHWLTGPYDCGATQALTCSINVQVGAFKWIAISAAEAATSPLETRIIDDVKYQNCINIIVPGYEAAINSDISVNGYKDYQTSAYAQASELAQNCSTVPPTGNRTYRVSVDNSNIFARSHINQVKRIVKLHSGVEATQAQINSGLALRKALPLIPPESVEICNEIRLPYKDPFSGHFITPPPICRTELRTVTDDVNWQFTFIRQLNNLTLY